MEDADEVQQRKGKLLYLESLRGIAALVVVLSHFALAFFPATESGRASPLHTPFDLWFYNNPLGIILAGNFSVCLFFVMSGYVLVRPFFLAKEPDLLTSAALRRYVRLMPPAALSVMAAYLLLKLGLFTNQAMVSVTGSQWLSSLWGITPHLHDAVYQAFVGVFFTNQATFNPLLWTMTTEFLGSMLIFSAAAIFGKLPRRWIVYALLAVVFIRSYFLGFVLGLALADLFATPEGESLRAKIRLHKPILAVAVICGLLLGAFPSDNHAGTSVYRLLTRLPHFSTLSLISFWHTLGAFLVVTSILIWPEAKKLLSHPALVRLGKMSFSIYLTHLILLCTVGTEAFAILHSHFGYLLSAGVTFVVFMLVVLGVGYAYTEYVDIPSIRWARALGGLLMSPQAKREKLPESQPAGEKAAPGAVA